MNNRAARERCIRAIRAVAVLGLQTGAALFILVVGLLVLTTFGRDCVNHRFAIVNTTEHDMTAVLSYEGPVVWQGEIAARAARWVELALTFPDSGILDGEFRFANGQRLGTGVSYIANPLYLDAALLVSESAARIFPFEDDTDSDGPPTPWTLAEFIAMDGATMLACADHGFLRLLRHLGKVR